MIRKQTWILLAVLVVLLGVAYYLQKNPLPASKAEITPSPTSELSLLSGFQAQDIVFVAIKDRTGNTLQLTNNGGTWLVLPGNLKVEAGKAEEVRAQFADTHVMSSLPGNFTLETGGLTAPSYTLTLKNSQGKQIQMKIGKETPVGDGYYVQVDNNAPVVVNKGTIDTLVGQLSLANLAPTPTPVLTSTAVGAATPSATPAP